MGRRPAPLTRRGRWRGLLATLLVVSTAGCSSGGPATSPTTTTPGTTTGTSSAPTTQPAPPTTTPATSAVATSAPATALTTVAPSSEPTSSEGTAPAPAELAGRVLCTFEGTTVPEDVLDRIADGRAAGVLLFAANLASAEQARLMGEAIQSAAARSPSSLPAIVAVDQEGGVVARIPGPPSASAAEMGTWPIAAVRAEAQRTATNLLSWGINVDLAPVADVARPGTFEDRQHRSFNADPGLAAAAVAAFVDGLHAGGVAATLKHFPGLGSVQQTTDDAPAVVALTEDELAAIDRAPFTAGVASGSELVMMSSAVYTSIAAEPAVLSADVVGTVLRGQLGFGGVVISDALDTPALASYGSLETQAVAAASAGVDLLIAGDPHSCAVMGDALAAAIDAGELPATQARESVERIEALRRHLAPTQV
ncbi:MAG: beta-N-acetylhexosaminidase [Actinobacteria bacterium]|nr:beta-N-acetylhexosaminidase [Actinomycetota bacterium]